MNIKPIVVSLVFMILGGCGQSTPEKHTMKMENTINTNKSKENTINTNKSKVDSAFPTSTAKTQATTNTQDSTKNNSIPDDERLPYNKEAEAWLAYQKVLCRSIGNDPCTKTKVSVHDSFGFRENDEQWINHCVIHSPCLIGCWIMQKCDYGTTEEQFKVCKYRCQDDMAESARMYMKTQEYAPKFANQKRAEKKYAEEKRMKEEAEREAKLAAERRKQEEIAARAKKRQDTVQALTEKAKSSKKYSCMVACVKSDLCDEILRIDGQTPEPVPEIYIKSNGEFSKDNFEKSPNVRLCTDICK